MQSDLPWLCRIGRRQDEIGIERAEEGVRGRAVCEDAEGARRVALQESGWSKES